MTKEEIKNVVRHVFHFYEVNAENCNWVDMNEACGEIFKALEQESCRDAISRQAVLDCLTATKLKKFDFILHAREEIKKLPSVNLQSKYEDIAKAFQFGLAFGFGKKYDEMDRVIDEIKTVIITTIKAENKGQGMTKEPECLDCQV